MKTKNTKKEMKTFPASLAVVFAAALAASAADADFTKAWSVGDSKFGADLLFAATDWMKTTSPAGYCISIQGKANGYLLGYSKKLAEGETKFDIRSAGITTITSGFLNLFGTDVARWSQPLIGESSFKQQGFYAKQAGGKTGFSVGPIGVTLSTSAEVNTGAQGSQSIEYSSKRPPVKKINAGPFMDAAVNGSVSADIYLLGAGVDASLKLTGWALNNQIVVVPSANANQPPKASWQISADTTSTTGKLEGWVRVGVKKILGIPVPGSKTFRKTFADYQGGPSSTVLATGSR